MEEETKRMKRQDITEKEREKETVRNASTSLVEPWPFILPSPLVSHYRSAAKHSEDRSPPCIGSRKWRISSLGRAAYARVSVRTLDFRAYPRSPLTPSSMTFGGDLHRSEGYTRDRSQRRPVARCRRLIFFTNGRMWSSRGTVVSSTVRDPSQQRSPRIFVPFDRHGPLKKAHPGTRRA